MQQEWDYLDELITDSAQGEPINHNYNELLLNKLNEQRTRRDSSNIAALSFIMAGFLALFIFTSDMQYKLTSLEVKARLYMAELQIVKDEPNTINYFNGE